MNEHAALKDGVSLGHHTKVGGEVEASIIEPYSNKQHHGFLGHSYVGSWVNLGAGTCNSDLKNTYGTVNMEYGSIDGKGSRDGGVQKASTGMQFVGCFIGDYAKTAINTSIFTGKTIGACSMVYGFVTTNVPAFPTMPDSFGQGDRPAGRGDDCRSNSECSPAARSTQRACDIQLLRRYYTTGPDNATIGERCRSQLSLEEFPLRIYSMTNLALTAMTVSKKFGLSFELFPPKTPAGKRRCGKISTS